MTISLEKIRIVLVGTTHPGNIGAAARVMKNMGLHRLYLVTPKNFPHVDATALAAGADRPRPAAAAVAGRTLGDRDLGRYGSNDPR